MATDYSMSGEPSVDYAAMMGGGVSGGADAWYTDPSYVEPTYPVDYGWNQPAPIDNNWVDPTMYDYSGGGGTMDNTMVPLPPVAPQLPLSETSPSTQDDYANWLARNGWTDPIAAITTAPGTGGLQSTVTNPAAATGMNGLGATIPGGTSTTYGKSPSIYDVATLMPGFGAANQGMNQQDALGGLLGGVANAQLPVDQGRVGPGGGRAQVVKKADPNNNEGRIANGHIFKNGKWERLPQRAQPNMGPQQQLQPRVGQPGQRAGVGAIPQRAMGGIPAPNINRPFAGGAGTRSYRGEGGASNAGAGSSSPKPNTSPIKAMLTDYQNAYKEAKKANEDRYADVLGGYRESAKALIAKQEALGSNQDEDIKRAYDQQAAMARQNAMSRGIGNTTVTDSLDRGVESDRQRALRAAANDRAAALINLMERAKAAELQFMERRTDSYPSLDTMANLAMQIGRADPNATFDYTPFLSDQTKKA